MLGHADFENYFKGALVCRMFGHLTTYEFVVRVHGLRREQLNTHGANPTEIHLLSVIVASAWQPIIATLV